MKILFLCHKTPYPANDGGAIATLNMINGFVEQKHDVYVLSMQTPKHSYSISEFPQKIKTGIGWNQVWVDTKIKPIALIVNLFFSNKPYNAVRFESKSFEKKLIELLADNDFDLIQLEGAYLESYVEAIRQNSKAKVALRAHNVESEIWLRLAESESNFLKRFYYKLLAKRVEKLESDLLSKIDYLVPITQKDAEALKFHNPNQVHVSNTGIALEKFKQAGSVNKKTLFHIGALDWRPNQEALLWFLKNVWSELYQKFPDWKFIVAGRNASEYFENELKEFEVEYVGEVDSAHEFMDENSLMIVPLFAGSGMRIKIIEGMARGKCILTSSIGAEGIPAISGKDIYICDSQKEWLLTLERLLKNSSEIDECGTRAYNFAKKMFCNENIIENLNHFYQQQLNDK